MKISEGKVEREVRLKWEKLDHRTDFNHVLNLIYTHTHTHPFWRSSTTLRINIKILNKAYRALPVSSASSHAPSPALFVLVTAPFSFLSKQGPLSFCLCYSFHLKCFWLNILHFWIDLCIRTSSHKCLRPTILLGVHENVFF